MAWIAGADAQLGTTEVEQRRLRAQCAAAEPARLCTSLEQAGYWSREASRTVHVPGFHLDREEVTVKAFAAWLRQQPRARVVGAAIELDGIAVAQTDGMLVDDRRGFRARRGQAELPVVGVTWEGAMRFCADRRASLPSGDQWEAATQRAAGPVAWGAPSLRCEDAVIERRAGGLCSHMPARAERAGQGRRDRTPEGVVDLIGNVSEWVLDRGDQPGIHEVRGGSYATSWLLARPTSRLFVVRASDDIGFRCAVTPDEAAP